MIVIADDLTGAAEIAGVGLRHGLTVEFVPDVTTLDRVPTDAELLVLNADSRGLAERDAAGRIRRLVPLVEAAGPAHVYKKIDSVLRGNVRVEIDAWIDASDVFAQALLVPQNPSRGRTIDAEGVYRIDGVPLHETAFARDPDHPATTADADALLGAAFYDLTIGRGTTIDDVRRHAARLGDDVLPVGSADFFHAILERLHAGAERTRAAPARAVEAGPARVRFGPAYSEDPIARTLFVCGSADATTRATLVARVPTAVELPVVWFSGEPPSAQVVADWASRFRASQVAALLAPADRCDPARVHALLCDAAAALIAAPVALYVDGGATAMALCRRMNWTALDVVAEVGPGAVTLAPAPGIEMTIKPGSYPWPEAVWEQWAP